MPMNDKEPYRFGSKLKNELVITGEHRGDYVQFQIGDLGWTSKEDSTDGKAKCDAGGWDPKEGPSCLPGASMPAKKEMDCCFSCDGTT